jgi:hypothetical protein
LSTDVSEVRATSIIALMMEAARTSETSVDNYFTRQYIPEDKSEPLNVNLTNNGTVLKFGLRQFEVKLLFIMQ